MYCLNVPQQSLNFLDFEEKFSFLVWKLASILLEFVDGHSPHLAALKLSDRIG